MLYIEPVNEGTFKKVVDMRLTPEQNRFVAPNVVSLAQAWLYYDEARPYAVLCDAEVVGFIMLDWDEGERTLGIWRFMIAPEQQRKGYGRQAVERVIELARASGKFDLLHLDYVPGNTAARELYYSLGFRENGDEEDGEIIMTLPLTDTPKVGILTADEEDIDDFEELIQDERQAGTAISEAFAEEAVKQAVADRRVKRLTLMGETIGLAIDAQLLLGRAYHDRLEEARIRLQGE